MLRSVLASAAAASLVLSPIAVSTATRASDTSVSLAPLTSSDQRLASPVAGAEEGIGALPFWGIVAILLAAGFTLSENFTSRGIVS